MKIKAISTSLLCIGLGLCLGLGAGQAAAQSVLISDDFETDTSADYTVVDDGAPDGTVTFNFDYIAAGIPLAPNSSPGDTGGLRFTANDTVGESDSFTAFHNAAVSGATFARLTVDVYMNVSGTGGTTEYANIGLAGDASAPNTVFLPISGSGTFLSFTGEGGSSTSDYRYFIESQTTTDSSDPSHLAGSGAGTEQLYQDIFPAGTFEFPGSPGNSWATVEIEFSGGEFVYSINGTPIIDTSLIDPSLITRTLFSPDGLASLGYADVFSSVADPFQSQFVVYDNLVVEVIPEPASAALLALLGAAAGCVRRRW